MCGEEKAAAPASSLTPTEVLLVVTYWGGVGGGARQSAKKCLPILQVLGNTLGAIRRPRLQYT